MAESICESFRTVAKRLMDLGLGYLSLDRASATLSTGERQRMQLARAVRNRTTGVLYVLDEPSIGLHPSNIVGLTDVMHDLIADGNSVILVDHDTQILSEADWVVEMGPEAGADGGQIIAQGTIRQDHADSGKPDSRAGSPDKRNGAAGSCKENLCRRHPAGQADRRRTHRHQCPLYRGHLCQCSRRAAQGLCKTAGGQSTGL